MSETDAMRTARFICEQAAETITPADVSGVEHDELLALPRIALALGKSAGYGTESQFGPDHVMTLAYRDLAFRWAAAIDPSLTARINEAIADS